MKLTRKQFDQIAENVNSHVIKRKIENVFNYVVEYCLIHKKNVIS